MRPLAEIRCFLLDLDGTVYLGDRLIPGAREFIDALRRLGRRYCFLTNNSSRSKAAYVDKLTRLGIAVEPGQVMTSGEATALYLKARQPGARIFLLGTEDLAREFVQHGFALVDKAGQPDWVVLGFDTTLTYRKLWDACDLIRQGVGYIATHPDFNCPLPGGRYMPDAGAIIAFIEASTGHRPKVIGKPNAEIIEAALALTQTPPGYSAMVGDRLYTDVAMARRAGLVSVLVLSGETRAEDLAGTPDRPDYVFPSVRELGLALERESRGEQGGEKCAGNGSGK